MKAIILLLILAAGAYLLLNGSNILPTNAKPTPARPTPPTVASIEPAPAPFTATPPSSRPQERTMVNPAEPIIEADGSQIAAIRGVVVQVDGEVATVDCSYLPQFDDSTVNIPMGMNAEYVARKIAEAKAQFYEATFGPPQIFTPEGKYEGATWTPKQKAKGLITLRGAPLGMNQAVHVLGATTKRTGPATIATSYTARFKTIGSTWMWSEGARTSLDIRKP